MNCVFVDVNGFYYKAEKATSPLDSEKPIGTAEFMAVLTLVPQKLEDLQQQMFVTANTPAVQPDITIASASGDQ